MPKAYLTIDDGPSQTFESLVDFLAERSVPAVFFNRGDAMEARLSSVVYGIKRGYLMANHAYSHQRFSHLPLEACFEEIQRTEVLLDEAYARADVVRPGKYFRFPYMDRGMGPYLIEPDSVAQEHCAAHHHLISAGLGHDVAQPGAALIEKKRDLQTYLKERGFTPLPMPGVTLPFYAESEMAEAIDSLCTFSTSDWALQKRHVGKHGFETQDDLKAQIDHDKWLHDEDSAHIILAHDQAEIFAVTTALVDYFLEKGFEFLDFKSGS